MLKLIELQGKGSKATSILWIVTHFSLINKQIKYSENIDD